MVSNVFARLFVIAGLTRNPLLILAAKARGGLRVKPAMTSESSAMTVESPAMTEGWDGGLSWGVSVLRLSPFNHLGFWCSTLPKGEFVLSASAQEKYCVGQKIMV